MFNIGNFALKALQLALIADQEYAATQGPGSTASTLLAPNNFQNLTLELAQVFTPAPAAQAPGTQQTGAGETLASQKPLG